MDPIVYWDIKRFYNKYHNIIDEISISNRDYRRTASTDSKGKYFVSAREPNTEALKQSKQRIEQKDILYLIYPVTDASGNVTMNLSFSLDIKRLIISEISKESLDKSAWIFFLEDEKIVHTHSISPYFEEELPLEFDPGTIASGIDKLPFVTGKKSPLRIGDYKFNLVYAYNSFNILKNDYGLVYAIERNSLLSGIRIVSYLLSFVFLLILAVTITTFRKLIKTIQEEQTKSARIKMAVDNATDLVLITDMNFESIYANDAFQMACDESNKTTGKLLERVIPEQHKISEIRQSLEHRGSWYSEIELIVRLGQKLPCLLRANQIKNQNGESIGFVFIATDITERKRAERLKNEFISTVSHELRTPLTSIRGSLGLIKGGVSGELPTHAKKLIDIAYSNSERLIRLINDILDIEKIEAGAMEFHLQKVDLLPEIQRSIKMMSSYASQYNVKIILKDAIENLPAIIDPDRFEQVMNNLLSNACKFSASGAEVHVYMKMLSHNLIRLSVQDYGSGIPEEFQKSIFGKFAQADSSDTRSKGGTGLGLSITKAIVEKFGGKIAYNTELGKGTEFYIDLPVYMPVALSDLPVSSDATHTILIIEDDPDIATLIQMVLNNGGYKTDIAYSAEEAKQKIKEKNYSLISLDLLLPKQQGISFIQELREDEATANIPIVVVSAVADKKQNELHGGFGIVDWISKPIDMTRLQRAISESLNTLNEHFSKGILHIEDDEDNIEILQQLLKDKAEITSAKTLMEAKHLISANNYSLVLLDLTLPDGSGLEIIPYLKQKGKQHIPVVIFSAMDAPQTLNNDIFGAMVKSKTSNDDLVMMIQKALDNNESKR